MGGGGWLAIRERFAAGQQTGGHLHHSIPHLSRDRHSGHTDVRRHRTGGRSCSWQAAVSSRIACESTGNRLPEELVEVASASANDLGWVVSRQRLDTLQTGIYLQFAAGVDLVGCKFVAFCLLNRRLSASESRANRGRIAYGQAPTVAGMVNGTWRISGRFAFGLGSCRPVIFSGAAPDGVGVADEPGVGRFGVDIVSMLTGC